MRRTIPRAVSLLGGPGMSVSGGATLTARAGATRPLAPIRSPARVLLERTGA